MARTANSDSAIAELEAKGIGVLKNWSREDTVQFAIAHACEYGVNKYFDMSGEWIKESIVNGEYVNRSAVRQDIIEILDQHRLEFDFYDRGTIVVCDNSEDWFPRNTSKSRKGDVPMSQNAFLAFKELARLGAPVWDFESRSRTYDPQTLPQGTQFVMRCEPAIDIFYADHPTNVTREFEETKGLHPEVFEIAKKYGLEHVPHTHRYDDPKFMPLLLVAFNDPIASPAERGKAES